MTYTCRPLTLPSDMCRVIHVGWWCYPVRSVVCLDAYVRMHTHARMRTHTEICEHTLTTCVVWLDVCAMAHVWVCHDSYMSAVDITWYYVEGTRFMHVCAMTHICAVTSPRLCHDSFMSAVDAIQYFYWLTPLIYVCAMLHTCVRNSLVHVPWRIYVCRDSFVSAVPAALY